MALRTNTRPWCIKRNKIEQLFAYSEVQLVSQLDLLVSSVIILSSPLEGLKCECIRSFPNKGLEPKKKKISYVSRAKQKNNWQVTSMSLVKKESLSQPY